MNPNDREEFLKQTRELQNGKVSPNETTETKLTVLLAPMHVIPIEGYYDFLKMAFSRSDN